MKLNNKQIEAVNHKEGPCLVLAGAGSGKTRVLTERINELIESGVSPYNILAITFTNKAAKEMRERISKRVGSISDNIFIGTFHSFGLKILRENKEVIGYKNNITILDRSDATSIIKKIIKENYLDETLDIKYIINQISFAKNEGLSPSEYSKYMKGPINESIAFIYEKYLSILKRNNTVDFDDLLILPLEIFKKSKEVLEKYQEHFKYLLIDEYQDTNQVQYDLCNIIAKKYRNLFVVGDIDQSIYAFRYANYENIINFEKHYKDAKVILLEQNYRSTQNILNAANDVIKNNKQRKEKNLWTDGDIGNKIGYIRCTDEKDEAGYIVRKIREYMSLGKDLNEIGVLYRTNAQSRVIEEALLRENIPFKIVGSYYFYNRKEIKDLISYLNLIYNENDDVSLVRVINTPKRGIGPKVIEKLEKISNVENVSLFEAISEGKELLFKEMILSLKEASKDLSLTSFIDLVLEKTGMKKELEENASMENEIRLENLEEFKSITKTFEEKGIYTLGEFLDNIALVSDMGQYKEVSNGVNVMTLHSAKGLEFDIVFLPGMEEGVFPHFRSFESEEEIEEERRLCYVGITRAKKELYLLNASSRLLFGKINRNIPSRFIDEISSDLIESETKEVFKVTLTKNMYEDGSEKNIKPGDNVIHDKFGEGVVIKIEKDLATIAFRHGVGIKMLSINHKALKKK